MTSAPGRTTAVLGIVLTSVNELLAPVGWGLSLLVTADLFLVRGKLATHQDFGGRWILGGGPQLPRAMAL